MHVSLWIFLIVLVWAIAVTFFLFVRNPLPFPDRGHRCFAVKSHRAVGATLKILRNFPAISERFTFDTGPIQQTLLWDNTTVIMLHPSDRYNPLPKNALSVVTADPTAAAVAAQIILKEAGFIAAIHQDAIPEVGNKLVILESNAFDGWVMVFRRHILALGKPPKQRKISK